MSTLVERAAQPLGTDFYAAPNLPEVVGVLELSPPPDRQYVLRCPLQIPGKPLTVPDDMEWCTPFIDKSLAYQRDTVKVLQPFTYLTIRHGEVSSTTDDEFHVDGFSMKVPHIPEQNYLWTDKMPTEVVAFGIDIPEDFDPLVHNIQYLIQDSMPADTSPAAMEPRTVYGMDPYVFHRRPVIADKTARTFLRLSLTPIPIDDINNTVNPAFGQLSTSYDGVKDFRDKLKRYPVAAQATVQA